MTSCRKEFGRKFLVQKRMVTTILEKYRKRERKDVDRYKSKHNLYLYLGYCGGHRRWNIIDEPEDSVSRETT